MGKNFPAFLVLEKVLLLYFKPAVFLEQAITNFLQIPIAKRLKKVEKLRLT